jgi:DNA (cytosine-5)-methyltransferase 3A
MNILSLFDGISCARVALDRAGIKVNKYYATEVDKHAIQISQKNYPDIVRLGDVREIIRVPEPIDLLIGGSPCQDLSIAKKDRKGLDGERSSLFWEYVRILELVKPKYFILENVASMSWRDRDTITVHMKVDPIMINASLVSAQCRKRLFWTNIPGVTQPVDRGILLKDILQPDADVDPSMIVQKELHTTAQTGRNSTKKLGYVGEHDHQAKRVYDDTGKLPALNVVCNSMVKIGFIGGGEQYGQGGQAHRVYDPEGKTPTLSSFGPLVKVGHIGNSDAQANRVYDSEGKSVTLSANGGGLGAKTGLYTTGTRIRKLTPIECERLQGLADNYTEGVAKTHRYKCLGNAFNVEVVAHILNGLAGGSASGTV